MSILTRELIVAFATLLIIAVATRGLAEEKKAAADQQAQSLFGVTTEFRVEPAEIVHADEVRITLKLTNTTTETIRFRYSSCFMQHVSLYDAKGKRVHFRMGVPTPECPYEEVVIHPGKVIEQTKSFEFRQFWSVPADKYELAFDFDRRLMEDVPEGQEPFVPWGAKRFGIVIKDTMPIKLPFPSIFK
jgi:hypothetical protein